jgi:predicted enzyme related to lactoylglutathione lyase
MPNIDHYAPGSFCWFELGTTDQNAAKSFYKALFGWDAMDLPMGPNDVYSMFMLDGRSAGAGYTLMPEMRAVGIPPHWAIYIAVANADEAAAKAAAAGGTVLKPAFDVFDLGRMAVIRDPTGAVFHVWQESAGQRHHRCPRQFLLGRPHVTGCGEGIRVL